MNYLFWGIPFMFDFKLYGKDFIPDILGIIIICTGLYSLKQRNSFFHTGFYTSLIMLGWVLFKYIFNISVFQKDMVSSSSIQNDPFDFNTIVPFIDLVTIAFQVILVYVVGRGIIGMVSDKKPELVKKVRMLGFGYFLFALISVCYRVFNLLQNRYVGWMELALFVFSMISVVTMMVYISRVHRLSSNLDISTDLASHQDSNEVEVEVDNESNSTESRTKEVPPTKAPAIISLICGVIANLPLGIYLLLFMFARTLSNPDDPSAGAGVGYLMAFAFIFLSIVSVLFGIIGGLIVLASSKVHRSLNKAGLLSSVIGGLQPIIILMMVSPAGAMFIWPGP
ncbi:hypothetical protein EJP82_10400 [Paenibacillus anaericanus]|uniref:Uncharacterized protein n=1 Tax=Paenibacillus anaericanus TaxID=170367 RepID=A0A3S1BPS1_9BACL|nr:hypothetical protein [Paenibacillus anaericanus]RUT46651.1 hypothetical protein EJP82_10400 [Paenibacillus anaericanus]